MKKKHSNLVGSTTPEIAFARSELGRRLLAIQAEGPASSQGIADFILRNSVRVTALGIIELGNNCKVSAATVSRFARMLGFPNYSSMRSAVAEALQAALDPVDKLRHSIQRNEHASSPGIESLDYARANIDATRQGLAAADVDTAVSRINRARIVYVMGFGLSSHLAAMLALLLQPFCLHVVDVVAFGGNEVAAGRLMNIGEKDVLVAISFPRYAIDAVKLSGYARSRGAYVVTISDSLASPLSKAADLALVATCDHPILPSSATAALALIETLTASLMVANRKNLAKAAELTEAIAPYLLETLS
ncbi:MAG: MurR/RpiR family transcriptional regulator [Pseudomonadota bacterium]